jgi:hypothetical protein
MNKVPAVASSVKIAHTPATLPLPMYLNPGPAHWQVRDEQGKISLDEREWLNFPPLSPPIAWGKQDVVADLAIPRGSLVLGFMRKTGGSYCQPLALVNSQAPGWNFCANVEAGFKTDLSSWLTTCQACTTGPPIARVVYDGTEYCLGMALLPDLGIMYFIKGGDYSNWTYLLTIHKGESPELYVASANYDASFAMKFVGAGTLPAIPSIFSDDFPSMHPQWQQDGSLYITGGRGIIIPRNEGYAAAFVGPFIPHAQMEVRFYGHLGGGEKFGLICSDRPFSEEASAGEWNGFICWHDGAKAYLDEVVGGVARNVSSQPKTFVSGHRFNLRRGAGGAKNIDCYWHGVLVGDTYTSSDPNVLAANYWGIFSNSGLVSFDACAIFPTGVNNEYGLFDSYL